MFITEQRPSLPREQTKHRGMFSKSEPIYSAKGIFGLVAGERASVNRASIALSRKSLHLSLRNGFRCGRCTPSWLGLHVHTRQRVDSRRLRLRRKRFQRLTNGEPAANKLHIYRYEPINLSDSSFAIYSQISPNAAGSASGFPYVPPPKAAF